MTFSILTQVNLAWIRQHQRSLGIGALILFIGIILFRACNAGPAINQDPFARYRPAMKAEFQNQLDKLTQAPRYDLTVQLDAKADLLLGKATVHLVNTSADPWPYLIFRLYPMLDHYGGKVIFQSVAVGDRPVPYVYQAHNTAMRMDLPEPLAPREQIDVRLAWKLEIPSWPDTSNVYALFGKSQEMTSLPLFYPALAVYQAGPAANTGQWWLDEGSIRGDAAFNVTSLFVVTATLPSDQIPVTSGTLITSTLIGKNQARHVWVTGPAREFLLHTSTQFRYAATEAYGTRITSYWLPGQEAAGRAALEYAIAALRIYSDRFGPYPYRDMRLAPAPLSYRGMEYPQASLLGVELYTLFRENLEILVAHEVAHQWWYQMVGNDPVNEPWLDEALAEYSMKLYMEELHGKTDAEELQTLRWQIPVDDLKKNRTDGALDQAVMNFATGKQYEAVIYGKGALFYDTMRKTLGDRQFTRFLQSYLLNHRYQIVDTQDWLAAIRTLNNPTLDKLYQEWVQKPVVRTPDQPGNGP